MLMINARILDQLDKIGQRLDKIENKTCKKSSDKQKLKVLYKKLLKQRKQKPKGAYMKKVSTKLTFPLS